MEYVRLGTTGLQVSRLCLGCMTYGQAVGGRHPWALPEEAARPLLRGAIEAGITYFDTANSYSAGTSEEILGRAVRDFGCRDDFVIATKVYRPMRPEPNGSGLSRKAIMTEIDASLRRLGTDYIDLYQIHRWDPLTPIAETLQALDDIVRAGKVRYLGASSMSAWQFAKALYLARAHGWSRFVSMQDQYNLLYREGEREMYPLCADEGIGVLPWSPLARGKLARPWEVTTQRSESDRRSASYGRNLSDRVIADAVGEVASEREVSRSQVALAWLLNRKPVTAPIIGVSQPHHLSEAVAALEFALSPEECARLERPYLPHEPMAMG